MRFTSTQASFKSGRLSPRLFGRIDSVQYRDGLSVLEGFQILPDGGAERVKGTRYLRRTYGAMGVEKRIWSIFVGGVHRIVGMKRLADNSIFIFTDPYPYYDDTVEGEMLSPEGDTVYLLSEFDMCVVGNAMVFTHFSGTFMPFVYLFDADGDPLGFAFMFAQDSVAGEPNLNFEQYNAAGPPFFTVPAEGLYGLPMSDPGVAPGRVTISNHTGTGATVRFDVTSSDPAVAAILQRSPEIYLEALGLYDAGDFDYNVIASATCAVVSTISDGVRVRPYFAYDDGEMDVFELTGVTSTDRWSYSLWYQHNWPRTCVNYEGRLVFGGCPESPLTIFGSQVNNRKMFNQIRNPETGSPYLSSIPYSGPTIPTDPYVFQVSIKNDSKITFLQAAQAMVIGTDCKEYIASGGDTIISALSVNIKPVTAKGSVPVQTANSGSAVYYLSSSGAKLHRFRYNQGNGTFVSQELSLLFSDLLEADSIKQIEWASHIQSLVILMSSGKVYGILDDESIDVTAFYDPLIDDVDTIAYVSLPLDDIEAPLAKGGHLVFLGNNQEFSNGNAMGIAFQEHFELGPTRRQPIEDQVEENYFLYIDRVERIRFNGDDWETNNGTMAYDGTIVPIFRAFYDSSEPGYASAFEGDVFVIKVEDADGIIPHEATILTQEELQALESDAQIRELPLDVAAEEGDVYLIGISPRTCQLATMPVEAGAQYGTAQMGIKNIDTIGIRYYKSYSFEFSSDLDKWQEAVTTDNDGVLTTGRIEKKHTASPKYDQRIWIRNRKPEPLTILSINTRGVSNDG